MPKNIHPEDDFDESPSANHQFKSVRREAHRQSARRREQVRVHGECRQHPDAQKIARAVIHIALAQAEAEARAAEERTQNTAEHPDD